MTDTSAANICKFFESLSLLSLTTQHLFNLIALADKQLIKDNVHTNVKLFSKE